MIIKRLFIYRNVVLKTFIKLCKSVGGPLKNGKTLEKCNVIIKKLFIFLNSL
jgi:hypothetical protein